MKRLIPLAALTLAMGGCTVMYDEHGRARSALSNPFEADTPIQSMDRVANAATAASPLLDAILPGAGVALTGVLAGLGYGTRRGRRTVEEKYETANEWFEDGLSKPQVTNTTGVSS